MDVLFGWMPGFGHEAQWLLPGRAVVWAVAGAAAVFLPALIHWGFTVDDALISVRYARHLAMGLGWRFNVHGPTTDGVTPLPWPLLLAPLSWGDPMTVLARAKILGLIASMSAGAMVGARMAREKDAPVWLRAAGLGVLSLSVPFEAYAVSGMETGVAGALATGAAVVLEKPLAAAALAGAAVSFRPEMAPWAFVIAAGSAASSRPRTARAAAMGLLALAPFAACCAVRGLVWGHVAPLAVLAKPSDLPHGLSYSAAASVVAVAPAFVVAPASLRRSPGALVLVAAALAHLGAVAMAGGDWMPFARLVAPVVPSLCLAGVLAGGRARPAIDAMRAVAALGLGILLLARLGSIVGAARNVTADRSALVAEARPVLGALGRVAALDIGWVGAATEGDVVDLAGLTDPQIAALPGGHTSKRVGAMLLLSRDPDALLLYAQSGLPEGGLQAWDQAEYARAVEARLAYDPVIARHFAPAAWLPLGKGPAGYVVLEATRRAAPP
jgi:hypothetical protein